MRKLRIFTLALDAMPMITWHLPVFNQLALDWHWYIAEGVAAPVKDTSWCKPLEPRLSRDGTSEYLNAILAHPRVTVIRKQLWQGKTEMCNACLERIKEPCVLLQVDADELWSAEQLTKIAMLFNTNHNCARFYAKYFIGPNLVTVTDNAFGNNPQEWLRAWLFTPGQRFVSHEPPVLTGPPERCLSRVATRNLSLVFQHYAYAFAAQVAFKERYYGYKDALAQWQRLQRHTRFPAKLKDFLPWVDDRAMVDRLNKTP